MASEAEGRRIGGTYWGLEAKICDSCKVLPSLLYCRADSAFLCRPCNARVHSANKLASRHERVWLCEVCEQAPASITCKADAAALCVSCDTDIHSANPLARRHHRIPVVPFYDPSCKPPSTAAAANDGSLFTSTAAAANDGSLFKPSDDDDEEQEEVGLRSADYFFYDADPYLGLDYASSMDARFHHTDSVVPVQTNIFSSAPKPPPAPLDLDFARSNPSYSVSSSEAAVVPDGMGEVSNGWVSGRSENPTTATVVDREARVMRYRERRKNRRFEKTIRYASRKAYAKTRPRIKGRFAKRSEAEAEVDRRHSAASASAIAVDSVYGVVPSF